MAYEPNSATGVVDMLQKIVTWLVTRGWTSNKSEAYGSGWRAHLSKNGVYVNLRALVNESSPFANASGGTYYGIALYVGTGYAEVAWNAQAGGPVLKTAGTKAGVFAKLTNGSIPSYHLFDDGNDNIFIVMEKSAGTFHYLSWGQMVKAGNYTGGLYFSGSQSGKDCGYYDSTQPPGGHGTYSNLPNHYVRADVDAFTGKWIATGAQDNDTYFSTGKSGCGLWYYRTQVPWDVPFYKNYESPNWYQQFQDHITSAMNQQINLLNPYIFVARDGGGYSLLGKIPCAFITNATTKGYDIASIFTIGSDVYMLFPNYAIKMVA